VNASTIRQVSATGAVETATSYVRTVVLTAAAAAATVELRGGSDGTGDVLLTVKAPVQTTTVVPLGGAIFPGGIHATLTGAGALASIAC